MNSDIHEAVTETLMRMGHKILRPTNRSAVKEIVTKSFLNMSAELHKSAPEMVDELDALQLSEVQKDAVVTTVLLLADPQIRSIGVDAARAIQECASTEKRHLKHSIIEKLQPRLAEIKKLHDEFVPQALRDLWGSDHRWEMTLDPENVRMMQSTIGDFVSKPNASKLVGARAKSYILLGGALGSGKALLGIIKLCTRVNGTNLSMPTWPTAFSQGIDREVVRCVADAAEQDEAKFAEAMFCPLKFAMQGLDAVRGVSDIERFSVPLRDERDESPSQKD